MSQLDCGIISTPVSEKNLTFDPVFYERFFAYVSDNYDLYSEEEIDVSSINSDDIWFLEEGNCFQNQVNSICSIKGGNKTQRNFIYSTSSIDSLRHIVENENGLTFVPELATINIPAEQEEMIKELKGEQAVREISIVTLKLHAKERQVSALKKGILASIPKKMQEKPDAWVVDTNL
jgi:LysR family hydrogen peroxide-inducible transcriptional activator